MGFSVADPKPHVVCIPYPAQGHITPMLMLAKLLHYKGFHITFVNTEFNHQRLLNSRGSDALKGFPDFCFKTIPDGLPPSDLNATQDIPALCESIPKNCLSPLKNLLLRLNESAESVGTPLVTCIISDGVMGFTQDVAQELGIPEIMFWTTSACGFMAYLQYKNLRESGIVPFKDEDFLTNGCLETVVNSVPGMKDMRLKDYPSFIRTTDPNDLMLNFIDRESQRTSKASHIILNTFDALETDVLQAMRSFLPPIHTVGPLHMLLREMHDDRLDSLGSNLWREDPECIKWLDSKEPKSVVLVNFGSIAVMSAEQMIEFAWGLANSKYPFMWIIRPDLVNGKKAILPPEFIVETKDRSFITNWCPQERVLGHPSVAGFLMHSGWNSTLDAIGADVPLICWPFFAEQQTNCWYCCNSWDIGMEIDNNVNRDEVENLVRELMVGDKGKQMKRNAQVWKKAAVKATKSGGSSFVNFERLVKEVLLKK
ncbi:hypothetical protein Sjap_026150 [Stephania japonica]|uniref:Glycosyltransferase n=1 Tax=Stephania japonica TaxID=461633 RepID=A0AAP0HG82_9MAGN